MTAGVHMAAEIGEAPDAVRRQREALAAPLAELVGALKRRPPQLVVTCARGSSGHAATFGKHLIERRFGIPVAAAAPNIASVYRQRLRLDGQFFLAVSQSGRSDDLVAQARSARQAGALTAAIVNATDSPLAEVCQIVLPMAAGAEVSVAATKTFVASLAVLLRLAASWAEDSTLAAAVERLPGRLSDAAGLDWAPALPALEEARSLIAIGRGPTLAIAREAALKLKETCNLHAEAFSGAEVLHGPVALIANRYPVLMFMVMDETAPGLGQLARDLVSKGAAVYFAGGEAAAVRLPALPPDHPEADAVCLIQSFYKLALNLAGRLGIDVDRPRHLHKITRTR
ncbi:MAG TPA: SIS domain-containing protein [Aestuariivirgaceae bacterium]|nr:SIS domain-containing protein [Aestuariivirgaceae bacterium]